jgi:flavin-dependent thymidylate synthase
VLQDIPKGDELMKIRFQRSEVFPQGVAPSVEKRLLQVIEICGRTAYKSEDKITEDSAKAFVLMLKKHGHLSVLEHSNIVLRIEADPAAKGLQAMIASPLELFDTLVKTLRERNAYHRVYPLPHLAPGGVAIAANLRGWIETLSYLKEGHGELHVLFSAGLSKFYPVLFQSEDPIAQEIGLQVSLVSEEEQLALLRKDPASDLPVFMFKFVCDRGITHEVVRHRVLSFTQESTRYVNYKNKGMVLILPEEIQDCYDSMEERFLDHNPVVSEWLKRAETIFDWYRDDLNRGLRPEIARDILPNLLKSEIFVSGRWSGWQHFIQLRDSQHAHPRIRLIAREVRRYFESLGLA